MIMYSQRQITIPNSWPWKYRTNMEVLPNWLAKLTSLQELTLYLCESMASLPQWLGENWGQVQPQIREVVGIKGEQEVYSSHRRYSMCLPSYMFLLHLFLYCIYTHGKSMLHNSCVKITYCSDYIYYFHFSGHAITLILGGIGSQQPTYCKRFTA